MFYYCITIIQAKCALIRKIFTKYFVGTRDLVLLRLNVTVNNFSVMSGRSNRFLGITCTFRGVNVSFLKDITRLR